MSCMEYLSTNIYVDAVEMLQKQALMRVCLGQLNDEIIDNLKPRLPEKRVSMWITKSQ